MVEEGSIGLVEEGSGLSYQKLREVDPALSETFHSTCYGKACSHLYTTNSTQSI